MPDSATPPPRSSVLTPRRVLVCLSPPPAARLATLLTQAGPPDSIRIVSTARQLANTVADGWPHHVVTDTVTAQTMTVLLARIAGHCGVVTVAAVGPSTLRAVIAGLLAEPQPDTGRLPPRLTRRQSQIVGMICDGMTNQQIANQLGIEVDTVKTHVTNTLRLFDATSRARLAALAVGAGLVRVR